MYEELLKRLMYCRNNAAIITDEELVEIAEEAADAIEERCQQVDKFMEEAARLYAKQPMDAAPRAAKGGNRMSGIYIHGMEMPTSCAECRLMADGWCYSVGLEQREKISTVKRPTWCPLVPVPPHGDLIERKAACFTDFEIAMCDGDYKEGMKMLLEKIESAPTIIPAEEGE